DLVVPGMRGGFSSNAALLIVAIVGTTVTPWQIFFQQSNVVDKRITPRWIAYERIDTVIGALVVVVGAAAIMIAAAFAFNGTAGIVLIPGAPLGLFTTAVQALAGLLLPGATLFLLLLCNDTALLGPWVNRSWFNALAGVIMGLLLMLSLILVVTTIFPAVDAG